MFETISAILERLYDNPYFQFPLSIIGVGIILTNIAFFFFGYGGLDEVEEKENKRRGKDGND